MRGMRQADLERLRRLLEDQLVTLYRSAHDRVRRRLATEPTDIDEPRDEGDAAQLSQEDGLWMSLAEGEALRAQRIEEALHRMSRGDFGRCLDCDTKIELERLEAVPWALRCAECQEELEGLRRSPSL
jgi:DnaK suppressor protein